MSVAGVAIASYHKIVHPGPVREGLAAFVISIACGLLTHNPFTDPAGLIANVMLLAN